MRAGERDTLPPFEAADLWFTAITHGDAVCAHVLLPSPGGGADDPLIEAVIERHADPARLRRTVADDLRRRAGAPSAPAVPRLRASVLIATRGRPELLARSLAAVAALDPPADEVVVVDNDPEGTARAVAEAAGARHAVQATGGHNAARRRASALATGDVLVFIDDDSLPPRHWLGAVLARFADASVGAVCGPVLAERLVAPEQVDRERLLGFPLHFRREDYDLATLAASRVGGVGCGANMAFRRELLESIGDAFPDDLEGGTPARSGGDLYALYRVLDAGARIVHEPAAWTMHIHPATPGAAEATAERYGTGFIAFLMKLLVEHRELGAIGTATWLLRRATTTALLHAVAPDTARVRVDRAYLRGAARGPAGWLAARRSASPLAPPPAPAPAPPPLARAPAPAPPDGIDLVHADSSRARNAAARVSSARVLVFVAADARPAPGLLERHLAAHEAAAGPAIVGGDELVANPLESGLAARWAALQADARRARVRHALVRSVADVGHSNLSVDRAAFLALGGFAEDLSGPRAAQELALRGARDGWQIVHAPEATTTRLVRAGLGELVGRAERSGREHARLAARHPEFAAAVDLRDVATLRSSPSAAQAIATAAALALTTAPARAAALVLARLLERARMRRQWTLVARGVQRGAFVQGWRRERGSGAGAIAATVELAASGPIELPAVGGRIAATLDGRTVAVLRPPFGVWHAELFDDLADLLTRPTLARLDDRPVSGTVDLRDCALALPPSANPDRFAASGCEIHVAGDWASAATALSESRRPVLAALLHGPAGDPRWLATAAALTRAERVAVAIGAGTGDDLPHPGVLDAAHTGRVPYPRLGSPPRYVAVRASDLDRLGGLHPSAGDVGPLAPALVLAERAVIAGLVAARVDVPGLDAAPDPRWARHEHQRALGALRVARGRTALLRLGLGWLADAPRWPSGFTAGHPVVTWLGQGADLARGALRARRGRSGT